jgi:hypothetical protein
MFPVRYEQTLGFSGVLNKRQEGGRCPELL